MADNRSIVITLKLDNGESSVEEQPTDTSAASNKSDKNSSAKAVAVFAAVQTTQIVISEAVSWGEYYWNKELTLNDDYVGQRNKNIAVMQINRAVGALGTIGSFTALGASAGPWGAAIGAVIGTVAAVASIARSDIQGQEQQDIQIRQMNAQLDFTRARAGFSLKAGSIGEDL